MSDSNLNSRAHAPSRGKTTADSEQIDRYRESLTRFRDKYMDFPQLVSVETLALCRNS